ncbi:MAG: PAS domain S-box protein, partial [Actinomycetota bacterium]|nr:PAS domain S-box protein [Actinomycetota bacterium]
FWRVWLLLAGPLTPVVVWYFTVHRAPVHSAPTELGLFALALSGFVLVLARLQLVSGDLARQRQLTEALASALSTLREQQEALEISAAVIEATKEAVIVTTVDGEVVQWNPAAEHVYGVPRNEALGESLAGLYQPQTPHVLGELLDKARSEGHAYFEKPALRKDGAEILVSGSISAISNGAGNVTHFVEISRDVTEAARLRVQLEDSERELQEAQRIGGIGSWSWDVVAGEVAWSEEMYRLLAVQPQRFTPSLDVDLVHPEDRSLIQQGLQAILGGADVELPDYRIVRHDGRVVWLRPRCHVQRDGRGVAQRLLGTMQDVTASKLAEQELCEQRDRLAIYGAIVESTDDAVIVTSSDGKVIAWNRGAAGLYGYTAEEVLGRHITSVMSAQQKTRYGEIMQLMKENRHVRIESLDVHKDGSPLITSVAISHVGSEDGRPTALVGIARDVTDAKRSEQRLKERLRREREFAGNASHQLRTPLTALRLRIEDVSQWPGLSAEVRDELVASLADINRLSNTIAGLLTFSRLGNYGCDDPVELSVIVREAAERWRSSSGECGRMVRLGAMEPVMMFVPRDSVRQVLDVLVENAILHGAGEITLEGLVDGACVRVRVRDEGQGIAAVDRERVFTRGYRRSGSPGEGIGLSLARELAQSMGARLEVAATSMTAFDLVVPRAPSA